MTETAGPLFEEYEKRLTKQLVQITRDNIVDIAVHLGWRVDFSGEPSLLQPGTSTGIEIGDWIDPNGSAFKDQYLRTNGWKLTPPLHEAEEPNAAGCRGECGINHGPEGDCL